MIILDIDLDYFFLPVFSGTLVPENKKDEVYHDAPDSYIDLIQHFNLKNFSGEIKVFKNHDEVYYELKKLNRKSSLIHVDAHDDVSHSSIKNVDLGNWITHCVRENLIHPEIFWINQMTSNTYRSEYSVENKKYFLNTSKLKDFHLKSKIDKIFITKSPEFCPNNNIDIQIIEYIKHF